MEAAVKAVQSLSKDPNIRLPYEPHHLSLDPNWRARNQVNPKRPFEEWYRVRLQYMTFCSDADRGVLLTRPGYDMREEEPKPVPKEVTALAKGGGEKKKLSLSDYKNKKTNNAAATSPLVAPPLSSTSSPAASQHKRDVTGDRPRASSATGAPKDSRSASDHRSTQDNGKHDSSRLRESDTSQEMKSQKSRDSLLPDTRYLFHPQRVNARKRLLKLTD